MKVEIVRTTDKSRDMRHTALVTVGTKVLSRTFEGRSEAHVFKALVKKNDQETVDAIMAAHNAFNQNKLLRINSQVGKFRLHAA